jgi:uncharacterized membrane protein
MKQNKFAILLSCLAFVLGAIATVATAYLLTVFVLLLGDTL